MKVFVYEWVSGGGLLGQPGPLPPSLLREGCAMARAVAEDFAQLPDAEVTLLRDVRVLELVARGCTLLPADSAAEHDDLIAQQFAEADHVLLIAPETDRSLLRVCQQAEAAGASLLSPNSRFVEAASSKQTTSTLLAAGGVLTPGGVVIAEGDPLPSDHVYPAVLKPLDGAGSEDTYLLQDCHETPPAYPWDRWLEPYCPGMAVSVSLLMHGDAGTPLTPCRQHLSNDGRLRYQGGSAPLEPGLASRAQDLAARAAACLPLTVGYVGIDLVLGSAPSGDEDYVIEVNPRLTTSYAGLRFAAQSPLAQAMLDAAEHRRPSLAFDPRPIIFDTDGIVSYADS